MSLINSPKGCPACGGDLLIERLRCARCSTAVEGSFFLPRLARLSNEEQRFVELFLVSGGSLKAVSRALDISYPTVRKKLDELIDRIESEIKKDEEVRSRLIKEVGDGRVSAQEGAKRLKQER